MIFNVSIGGSAPADVVAVTMPDAPAGSTAPVMLTVTPAFSLVNSLQYRNNLALRASLTFQALNLGLEVRQSGGKMSGGRLVTPKMDLFESLLRQGPAIPASVSSPPPFTLGGFNVPGGPSFQVVGRS